VVYTYSLAGSARLLLHAAQLSWFTTEGVHFTPLVPSGNNCLGEGGILAFRPFLVHASTLAQLCNCHDAVVSGNPRNFTKPPAFSWTCACATRRGQATLAYPSTNIPYLRFTLLCCMLPIIDSFFLLARLSPIPSTLRRRLPKVHTTYSSNPIC